MTETAMPDAYHTLLAKVFELIKAQAAGDVVPFTADNLNHVYLSLCDGKVDQQANDLLDKIIGPDWKDGLNHSDPADEIADEAKHAALVGFLQQIDETKPEEVITTLASALMITCKELGWLEASREAHDQWFFSPDSA